MLTSPERGSTFPSHFRGFHHRVADSRPPEATVTTSRLKHGVRHSKPLLQFELNPSGFTPRLWHRWPHAASLKQVWDAAGHRVANLVATPVVHATSHDPIPGI